MGRSRCCTALSVISVIVVVACVFAEPPTDATIDKASEGLSTSSDTSKKESESVFIDGLNAEQLEALRQHSSKQGFQAEVDRMMKLIINSLYKNKEIFLRELISNAADALDKIRLMSLTDPSVLSATDELSIRIKANKDSRTLHIIDTGIGMSEEDLTTNLGTIAKSGTADFLEELSSQNSTSDASDLIGQFGVGFYSSFLVSSKVMVISKKNGHEQFIWESDSKSFSIAKDPRGDTLKRGTELILFLNEEADDYLQPETLKKLVQRYSQFVNIPIYIWSSRIETVEEESTEPVKEAEDEKEDSEANVEEEKKEPKKVEKTVWDWVRINEQKSVWKKKPADVTEDEHKELYTALSNDQDKPLARIHFKAEGDITFTSILYIPKRGSHDLFSAQYSYKDRIKLYVHRVFISDAAEELLPKYLGFVLGIVDSDDLPLNVSREMLQQNELVKVIRKKLIRKIIEMISKLSDEDTELFWKEYGIAIKLGMVEDHSNRLRLSKLLRYRTSKSGEKLASFADYVSRMKKDQETIFYLTAASIEDIKKSPFAERLTRKGYEIIYMTDAIDEYLLQAFTEYDKKPLQNIAKEGVKLGASDARKARMEADQKDYEDLLKWLKEDALKDKIEKAEISERLSDSPCALIAGKYGWSGNMERIMRAQAQHRGDDSSASYYSKMPKVLEINPRHPLIRELKSRVKADSSDTQAKDTAEMLLYMATLRSGYTISDSVDFARKVELVMRKNLNIGENEEVEPDVEDESLDDEQSSTEENKNEDQVNEEGEEGKSSTTTAGSSNPEVEPETEQKDEL